MVLLLWLRLVLFVAGLILLGIWFATGRSRQLMLRIAGGCVLVASLLTLVSSS